MLPLLYSCFGKSQGALPSPWYSTIPSDMTTLKLNYTNYSEQRTKQLLIFSVPNGDKGWRIRGQWRQHQGGRKDKSVPWTSQATTSATLWLIWQRCPQRLLQVTRTQDRWKLTSVCFEGERGERRGTGVAKGGEAGGRKEGRNGCVHRRREEEYSGP